MARGRRLIGIGAFRCLIVWFIACMTSATTHAVAQDHITERAWMEDTSRQMRWSDVQQQVLQPFTGTLNKGFGHSVIWLRLRVDPNLAPPPTRLPERLVLRIRPVYLDEVRVHDPLSPDDSPKITGDLHPKSEDEIQSLDLLLPIPRGQTPRDIWLRLDSTSTRQIDVQALNEDTLHQSALNQSLVFAGYLALVFLLAVWGLVHWLFSRDRLIGAFSIKQMAAMLFALCSLGYLRALWPVNWPIWLINQATNLFSITAVSAAILFHVLLIREFKPPRWIERLHLFFLGLFPIKLLLLMMGWPVAALRINMSEVLLSPLIFLSAVLLAKGWVANTSSRPVLSRALAVGFYSALLALLTMAALPGLGLTDGNEIGLYIVQVHGLVTAFLVLLMLQYREHIMRKKQHEIAMALDLSQMQAQQERNTRQEQEKLLAMLAHELKTPLATIHMRLDAQSSGSRQIKQAIRDMNSVIERCQQTTQLDDRQIVPHLKAVDLRAMVTDAISSCTHPERIELDIPAHMPWIQTDPQLLPIVLNNLLENACKYAAPHTPIQVRLMPVDHSEATCWVLEIDNEAGPAGWPDADKVFEKYYRSPHARRQTGSGLGLYLVHHLMQKLGGLIDYAPTQDRIRFILSLPTNPSRTNP
jgi:signal transduction histidine kinase